MKINEVSKISISGRLIGIIGLKDTLEEMKLVVGERRRKNRGVKYERYWRKGIRDTLQKICIQ